MKRTVGVFWLNAAETWVDVREGSGQNVVSSIVNFMSGSTTEPQMDVRFISESGIIDAFFMLGPGPKDVFRQYAKLTGTAPLPQVRASCTERCLVKFTICDIVIITNNNVVIQNVH